jgi:hypothetical protein
MRARCIAVFILLAMGFSGWAQSQSQDCFALNPQQVARALSDRGMQIAQDHISLLANVVATEPHPVLDVLSFESLGIRWSSGHAEAHSLVKLGCHLPGKCLPFYAIVSWPEGTTAPGGGAGTPFASANNKLKANAAITMRVGTHAMLEMDDQRSHVKVSVISLENGNAGDRIRVSSPDRKQVYTAEVIGANLLKRSY